jgi:hypothetical protein
MRRRTVCRHCSRRPASRARGLCNPCHKDRGVRALYPDGRANPGHAADRYGPSRPPEPTAAVPGSEERLRVLMGRAERGEAMKHPADAGFG